MKAGDAVRREMVRWGCSIALAAVAAAAWAQAPANAVGTTAGEQVRSTYVLGPGDQILVRVMDLEEMGKEPYQIDMRGNVNLPMAGADPCQRAGGGGVGTRDRRAPAEISEES
jgi:protein involved in polysaccharide export with SLBB domain